MWNKELDIIELNYATLRDAQDEAREEERLQFTQRIIDSACNFLRSGFPADVIAKNLNLPLEQVLQLQNELTANP